MSDDPPDGAQEEVQAAGRLPTAFRFRLARQVFRRMSRISSNNFYGSLPRLLRMPGTALFAWSYRLHSLEREMSRDPANPQYNIQIEDSEQILLPFVWVAELYTPSYARSLARRVRKAGWKTVPIWRGDVSEVVRTARERGRLNSTVIAKLVLPSARASPLDGTTGSRLPAGFKSIEVTLVELGNSLTALVAAFELDDEATLTLDRQLRAIPEPTVSQLSGTAHSVHTRLERSNEMVAQRREAIHDSARKWLTDRVPGVFAEEASIDKLPVMDLILTRVAEPFVTPFKEGGNYLGALGLDSRLSKTTSGELPGIELSVYQSLAVPRGERLAYNLSGRFSDVLSDEDLMLQGGGRSARTIGSRVNELVPRFLARLSISDLFEVKSKAQANARDVAHREHGHRAIRSTKKLREALLRGSLDTVSVGTGVKDLTSNRASYKWNVVEFHTEPRRVQNSSAGAETSQPENQLDFLAKLQRADAKRLLAEDMKTREVLGVVASLNASITSIRTQRWAIGIAVLSLVTALAAILLTSSAVTAYHAMLTAVEIWLRSH